MTLFEYLAIAFSLVFSFSTMRLVAGLCERVMVMYGGRIVERGPAELIFGDPQHPYTLGLLRSMPRLDEAMPEELRTVPGQPPNLQALPPGCAFNDRCTYAFERCTEARPELAEIAPGRRKACHLAALP